MDQQPKSVDISNGARCLLSAIAADYDRALNEHFEPQRGGTQLRVPFKEAVARDLRGQTDYDIVDEARFQHDRCKALLKRAEVAAANGIFVDWSFILIALRARIERFSFTVDYMSYLAAFCALFVGITLALASSLGPQNYAIAALVALLGVFSFVKGSTMRRRVLLYKELTNLIEVNLKALTAFEDSKTSAQKFSETF